MVLGVIQFPDFDKGEAVFNALNKTMRVKTENIWYEKDGLNCYEALFINGGTAWLNYSKLNNIEVPILESLFAFAEKGGYIFGIGEGFRMLCQLKLLPGQFQTNTSNRFLSRNVHIKVDNSDSALTTLVDKSGCLRIPLSCVEGQYVASENELTAMRQNKQILFRYCDEKARVSEKINYTGSTDNIAAVCNENGNIFGILPSIELATDEFTGNSDGRYILESILAWIK